MAHNMLFTKETAGQYFDRQYFIDFQLSASITDKARITPSCLGFPSKGRNIFSSQKQTKLRGIQGS